MLKIRRVWRRTSSSQAEPSPWRHCWTSWASCSNVSSASKPATVTSLPQKLHGANFGLQLWNANCSRKVPCCSGPGDRPRVGASYSEPPLDTSTLTYADDSTLTKVRGALFRTSREALLSH